MNAPSGLVRLGWSRKTLTAGMPVIVMIYPLRDGSIGGHLLTARLPNGTQMDAGRDPQGLLQRVPNSVAAAAAARAVPEKTES